MSERSKRKLYTKKTEGNTSVRFTVSQSRSTSRYSKSKESSDEFDLRTPRTARSSIVKEKTLNRSALKRTQTKKDMAPIKVPIQNQTLTPTASKPLNTAIPTFDRRNESESSKSSFDYDEWLEREIGGFKNHKEKQRFQAIKQQYDMFE